MNVKFTTLSGQVIEYPDPDPKLERFLYRAQAVLNDKKASEDDLVALIYGAENPLLGPSTVAGRGMVTRDVLDHPVYAVLADFVVRKHVQQEGIDPERLAAKYTLTVAEAAERKGVSVDAIRKAIRERRLPAWVKAGVYHLEPKSLEAVALGTRGPIRAGTEPLTIRYGYNRTEGAFLKVRDQDGVKEVAETGGAFASTKLGMTDELKRWRRIAVLTGGHGKVRFFELVPSTEEDPEAIEFHGFFVRGKFSIIRKVNNPKAARQAWEAFKAS